MQHPSNNNNNKKQKLNKVYWFEFKNFNSSLNHGTITSKAGCLKELFSNFFEYFKYSS